MNRHHNVATKYVTFETVSEIAIFHTDIIVMNFDIKCLETYHY